MTVFRCIGLALGMTATLFVAFGLVCWAAGTAAEHWERRPKYPPERRTP